MKPIFTLLTALLFVPLAALQAVEPPHILIREALQFENIGDSGRVRGRFGCFISICRTRRSRFGRGSFMSASGRC